MKEIIIHVGAGKTGTSALQKFFFLNEHLLSEKDVHFPAQGRVHVNGGIQHHRLSAHAGYADIDPMRDWKRIAELDFDKVVVSSENFHSKIEELDGFEFFSSVKGVLSPNNIKIIFYVRRLSDWLESAYAQFVKGNLQARRIDEFVDFYNKNIFSQVFKFSDIFGVENIIVRPYERSQFPDNKIEKDFLSAIGVQWDDRFISDKGDINPRLSLDALEIKRRINRFAQDPRQLRKLQSVLLEYSSQQNNSDLDGKVSLLSFSKRMEIENSCSEMYEKIARQFLGRPDGILFEEDVKASKHRTAPLSGEDLIDIFSFLIFKSFEVPPKN